MTARLQNEIVALLSEADLHTENLADEISSDADSDISAVLFESIKKAQETSKLEFTPEDNAFVDSCLAFDSDNDWEFMKTALLDALNTPHSGSFKSPSSDLDEEMGTARESDEETADENEVVAHEGIFGIWNLEIEDSKDEEIGLIKDLKEILIKYTDTNTVAGPAEEERLNSETGGLTTNIEELVADLENLSLCPGEGWDDKIFS